MSTYLNEVQTEKRYIGNVVIKIGVNYFAIRQPDSGLVISSPFDRCVQSLVLNPTTVDLRNVTTTIASYSFKLIDKELAISALVKGNAADFIKQEVTIWLGRSGTGMDFADYYQLPKTRIQKASHPDNSYTFSSVEDIERMQRSLYDQESFLYGDILPGTTTIVADRDISEYPTAGLLKIDDEFMSYSSIDTVLNRFNGVIRGELNSIPATHTGGTQILAAESITDNPINILLKILTSGGGGGPYDVLRDGLGISSTLLDFTEIETIRDNLFSSRTFSLALYSIDSALKVIEDEILAPLNIRFSYSQNSKITLAVLDKAVFVDETGSIDEDSITKFPQWDVDGNRVVNVLKIAWDYDEPSSKFLKNETYKDADSIAKFGEQTPLNYEFKGVKAALDGADLISYFAGRLLARLSSPVPEVSLNAQMDKSLRNIGDKTYIKSSQLPSSDGTLNFASEMEIVSRAINIQNGDVQFKLAFTSFTDIRSGYVAPSDLIQSISSQKKVTLPAGRGAYYKAGWVMRLWDASLSQYTADPINTIESISGDDITFVNSWATTLTTNHRIKFCDYDDATESQKRYSFISSGSSNFADNRTPYLITF